MNHLVKLVQILNQNKIFKFFSSVKLAVPLMLSLAALVAWGTVIESRYNSEYASMIIYKAEWFSAVLILLWTNIFCATISRIPFKKHHTGFVITHIGLLTILIGGFLTNSYGIDGQLSVSEGETSSTVVLPHLMVGYQLENVNQPVKFQFKKSISEKDESDLSSINDKLGNHFKVIKYIPFAKAERMYQKANEATDDVAVSFILKSNFFNVSEWLHTANNPQMQLGPATLKIIKVESFDQVDKRAKKTPEKKGAMSTSSAADRRPAQQNSGQKNADAKPTADQIKVVDFKSGKTITAIKLSELRNKPVMVGSVKVELVKSFRSAVVSDNKIEENLDPSSDNPAVELKLSKGDKSYREVLYAKFDSFSLNKDGVEGLKFSYLSSSAPPTGQVTTAHASQPAESSRPAEEAPQQSAGAPSMGEMGERVIEFQVTPSEPKKVKLVLIKNGEVVQTSVLEEGQNLQTPWMGMQIFLGSIQTGAAESTQVVAVNPEKRSQLPPSAIMVRTVSGEEKWLVEGQQTQISSSNQRLAAYFGREFIELPFDLKLLNFRKRDYPGTNTPMSYESDVTIGNTGITKTISMNEPLKQSGFTIYQASYILEPNRPPVSVFSVNYDPGRAVKYWGSLILAIGVIVYTYMKSSFYKKLKKD